MKSAKMKNLRTGDTVQVVSGNYKGARGPVIRSVPGRRQVVVKDVNVRKHHKAPTRENPEGGIVSIEAPIQASNVMLVCPKCDAPRRVRRKRDLDGTVERLCRKCGALVASS